MHVTEWKSFEQRNQEKKELELYRVNPSPHPPSNAGYEQQ
jgi:hypothetical protein